MKEADRLFSLFIRRRDQACVSCGRREALQCAHIFSRSYKRVRFDPENAVALCVGCHKMFTHRPLEWEDFCKRKGFAWQEMRYEALHGPLPVYREVIVWLRSELG